MLHYHSINIIIVITIIVYILLILCHAIQSVWEDFLFRYLYFLIFYDLM